MLRGYILAVDPAATLGRISLRMASLDLDAVLGEITTGLVRDLDAAMARIWLLRAGTLHLASSAGLSTRRDGSHAKVPLGALKIGLIAQQRVPMTSGDVAADDRFTDKPWIAAHGLVGFAGYPLLHRGELLGVLAIFARRALEPRELELLEIFAAQAAVAIKNADLHAEVKELTSRLESENRYLRSELGTPAIVGESPVLRAALEEAARVAKTPATVLLMGETGTGKELFARAIHDGSGREGTLVRVNCAAIAPTLIESELFGHEKGAFTGATQRRIGRFELAHRGTLFLDEIGELPLAAQAKLLRVLQEHELERVGGSRPIHVDARIVAATNRDLEAEVKAERFRSDLFFRLNVFPIVVPPLRARREDIPLLASAFLRGRRIEPEAMAYLQSYEWPGNVRELHNVLERAAILARGAIGLADLPELAQPGPPSAPAAEPLRDRVRGYEKSLVADALRQAEGNQSEAARALGMSRATLQYRMKALGL